MQIILAVDDNGKFLEYIPKEEGHTGLGKRHLAIAVILENSKGQVLLQKRKHQIFNNIWDITGATHPLHLENNTDETLEEATVRCLKEEWDIKGFKELKRVGAFNYFAQYDELCENEYCYLLTGRYDGEVTLNPHMGYEYKWVNKQEFLKDIANYPQKYTKWAQESVRILEADSTP